MKSKHLAKADFLRRLSSHAESLYELGDFTCANPERTALSSKIAGFADAGITLEVVTPEEVQSVIDKAHMQKFGESREARRTRLLEEKADELKQEGSDTDSKPDWDIYDSPAKNRKGK